MVFQVNASVCLDVNATVGDPVYSAPRFESIANCLKAIPVCAAALGPVAGIVASRLVASHFSVMTKAAHVFVAGPQVVQRSLGYPITKGTLISIS